jgi:peptidoglycan hydrolase CwlO-like protein
MTEPQLQDKLDEYRNYVNELKLLLKDRNEKIYELHDTIAILKAQVKTLKDKLKE